jgi:hypothetical protein
MLTEDTLEQLERFRMLIPQAIQHIFYIRTKDLDELTEEVLKLGYKYAYSVRVEKYYTSVMYVRIAPVAS